MWLISGTISGPRGAALHGRLRGPTVMLAVNETWNRTTAAELTRAFEYALA
jgi:hypothetical protein